MKITLLRNIRGFTLFELMLGMAIFGLMMTSVLQSVASITVARQKSMNRIVLLEELYFFSEKLATGIKEGGIIDYEEYWNRQVVGTGTSSGHYITPTGYGNYGNGGVLNTTTYGSGYYYCRSGVGISNKVGTGGCLTVNNSDINGINTIDYSGRYQRYGQYKLQFTDYNGNYDADLGDEDGGGGTSIRGDEDDKEIGDGPIVLSGSSPELYLINPETKERLYFRWIYKKDPSNPGPCTNPGDSGCLGNIEILKLRGLDIGMSHTGTITDAGAFDGEIDTWVCHPDWICSGPDQSPYGRIPSGSDAEWVPLFPDYVNVKKISFTVYPQKDPWRSWAASDCIGGLCPSGFITPFVHPYVRLDLTMGLAWERRRLIAGDDPTIAVSTTISLSNSSIE